MDARTIRILLIGSDSDDARWLRRLLTKAGTTPFELVHDELAFANAGQPLNDEFDVILFAHSLVDDPGLSLFTEVQKRVPQTPIIVLTDTDEEALALEVIRRGARDCLFREQIDSQLLTRSIRYAIERQRSEAELRRREAQFRKVIYHNSDGILIVDQDGIVQFANPASETLFNRPVEEMLGTMFGYPVVVGESTELDVLDKSGKIIVAEMRVVEIEWEGDKAYLASTRDITERKIAAQQQLELQREREKAQVLREFLSPAQHDFRTPFTVINLSLAQLRRASETEQQLQFVARVETQVARLEQLLLDMLTMSQLDLDTEFEFDRLDINRLIQDILTQQAPYASPKNHKLEFVPGESISWVVADGVNLARAITNVILNAVEYTQDGDTINVQTYEREQQVVVEVADSGIGISSEDLPHIFERFYRADKARNVQTGASGLGLAITKKIVDRHQGSIEVESTLGKGSIFRIILPAGR